MSVFLVNSLAGVMMVLAGNDAIAQPVDCADGTLGAGGSEVMRLGPVDEIGGGWCVARMCFIVFRNLGVAEGRSAYFLMLNSSIETIFARVTGEGRSDILGTFGGTRNGGSVSVESEWHFVWAECAIGYFWKFCWHNCGTS
ncbi:MAG: filamentous hemagglutinin N-terminal domain-containing protein [Synechococcales cyanobacterium RU_4_20]|nr:filamentous hemagglutinin N-terminal domain-containing protein [Synechococcales cyanobacterium RU_4_20]